MNRKENIEELLVQPYRCSKRMPHMSMRDRAAQFAPFAALTGYEEVLQRARNSSKF